MALAFVVPPLVDWNQFSGEFEKQMEKTLGQPVVVRSQTSLRLFPLPYIEFYDVTIGGITRVDRFQMHIELAPLLRGEIKIANLELIRPQIKLEINEAGNFNFAGLKANNSVANNIQFENINIVDGTLEIFDKRFQRTIIIETIDFIARSNSFAGPWQLQGDFIYNENRYFAKIFTQNISSENDTSRLPMAINIVPQFLPTEFNFNGAIIFEKNRPPRFSSNFQIKPNAKNFTLKGNFDLSTFGALINEYEINFNDYKMQGMAFINFGEIMNFQITANGSQAAANIENLIGENWQIVLQTSQLDFEKISGGISLNLPNIIYRENLIKNINVRVQKKKQGWRISNVQAELEGGTNFSATAELTASELSGEAKIENINVSNLLSQFDVENLAVGQGVANVKFKTVLENPIKNPIKNLVAKGNIEIANATIKTINPKAFYGLSAKAIDENDISNSFFIWQGFEKLTGEFSLNDGEIKSKLQIADSLASTHIQSNYNFANDILSSDIIFTIESEKQYLLDIAPEFSLRFTRQNKNNSYVFNFEKLENYLQQRQRRKFFEKSWQELQVESLHGSPR